MDTNHNFTIVIKVGGIATTILVGSISYKLGELKGKITASCERKYRE